MKQQFQEHMERSKKLAKDFRGMGVNIDFDEDSGEITIKGSEMKKFSDFPKSCEECRKQDITRICEDKKSGYVCLNKIQKGN